MFYKANVNKVLKNLTMYLQDKHCYKTTTLNETLASVSNMLKWWITVYTMVFSFPPQVSDEIK